MHSLELCCILSNQQGRGVLMIVKAQRWHKNNFILQKLIIINIQSITMQSVIWNSYPIFLFRFLHYCATTIQRHFRGHKGREIYRRLVQVCKSWQLITQSCNYWIFSHICPWIIFTMSLIYYSWALHLFISDIYQLQGPYFWLCTIKQESFLWYGYMYLSKVTNFQKGFAFIQSGP